MRSSTPSPRPQAHRTAPSAWRPVALAALATLLALGGSAAASAQSLKDLYAAARVFDATYQASRALSDAARYRAAQAEALGLPAASLFADVGTARNEPTRGPASTTTNLSASLNGRVPLFNRANGASIQQARKSLLSAQADLDTAEQDLIVRVAGAYFDVLAAQDNLGTVQANKTATTEQLASAKRNFEVGTATITDTREAQARFDLVVAQEIAADNDLRAKRIALDQLVGRNIVEPRPLKVPVVLPATVPANPEEWVTVADSQHPTVRRARVGLEIAQLESQRADAGRLPTVDAVGSIGPGTARTSGRGSSTSTNASVGVQLTWPLYTGGLVQNRIKEALALEEKSRNDLEAARRGVAQATRVAWFGVQSGQAQVRALEAAEASTQLALEATQLGYRVGVRVNLDVLNAQSQLFNTRRDLARARYDVLLGSLRLRQASGQLGAGDVDALNQLLMP